MSRVKVVKKKVIIRNKGVSETAEFFNCFNNHENDNKSVKSLLDFLSLIDNEVPFNRLLTNDKYKIKLTVNTFNQCLSEIENDIKSILEIEKFIGNETDLDKIPKDGKTYNEILSTIWRICRYWTYMENFIDRKSGKIVIPDTKFREIKSDLFVEAEMIEIFRSQFYLSPYKEDHLKLAASVSGIKLSRFKFTDSSNNSAYNYDKLRDFLVDVCFTDTVSDMRCDDREKILRDFSNFPTSKLYSLIAYNYDTLYNDNSNNVNFTKNIDPIDNRTVIETDIEKDFDEFLEKELKDYISDKPSMPCGNKSKDKLFFKIPESYCHTGGCICIHPAYESEGVDKNVDKKDYIIHINIPYGISLGDNMSQIKNNLDWAFDMCKKYNYIPADAKVCATIQNMNITGSDVMPTEITLKLNITDSCVMKPGANLTVSNFASCYNDLPERVMQYFARLFVYYFLTK